MKRNSLAAGLWGALALFAIPGIAAESDVGPAKVDLVGRAVPDVDRLPNDGYGKLVRYGRDLTLATQRYVGPEVKDKNMRYAGNNLACASCHQEGGTLANAIPFMGVAAVFPQYRGREDDISTVEERVNGCMQRSMNGKPLPWDSREMKAFTTYIHFLSRGIPVGAVIDGAGMKPMKAPNRRADSEAGAALYAKKCVKCHGADGQGERIGVKGDALGYDTPPLWGPDSFNDGAGMARLTMAMRFIKHNMVKTLSDDEAYDIAAFVISQPRPHKEGLDRDFPARWNKPIDAAFPPYMEGVSADQHKYGPFPPLAEKARKLAEEKKSRPAALALDAEAAQTLANQNGCLKCHASDRDKEAPSYKSVAAKYKGKNDAETRLLQHINSSPKVRFEDGHEEEHKVIKTRDETQQLNLVRWILSR